MNARLENDEACAAGVEFSLVVATLDDGGELALLLESLARQQQTGFEVIVVDQNADDRLGAVIAAFERCYPLRHVRVDFRSATRARNLGASMARGRWLSFPDDDCRYHADTLARAREVLDREGVLVATGRTVDERMQASVLRWHGREREFDRWSMFMCLTEATLFVDRELFLRTSGFDERFGPGGRFPAAEGIELMNRLFDAAHRDFGRASIARFDPAIQMYHPNKIPPWNAWAVRRFFSYAVGDGALVAKNPKPHILAWAVRTLGAACLQALFFRGWVSVAFAARIAGMMKGFTSYTLERWQGR